MSISPLNNKKSMKENVYATIKSRILTQEYVLGSKVNIQGIASELQVSNTPVREALSKLEKDGLVSFFPNSGFKVLSLDSSEVHHIESTMAALLTGSFLLCQYQNKREALVKLMETRLSKQKEVLREGSQMELAHAAMAFDETFLIVLDNKELNTLYQSIFDKMALLVYYDHRQGNSDIQAELHEHEEILEAVKSNNGEKVVDLIMYHFDRKVHLL